MTKDERTFLDGVMWAATFMAVSHGQDGYAEDILKESGYTGSQLFAAQKRNNHENRRMNKIIRNIIRKQ